MQSLSPPSAWLVQHIHHVRPGGRVLDLAAGRGRNAIWLAGQGYSVEAVDRDADALHALKQASPSVHIEVADLETGQWPYSDQLFDAIVVCRYLHRPLLPLLAASLAEGGVLIYETFMQGHERYGRPANPDFLLQDNELLEVFAPLLSVLAYEAGMLQLPPNPAMLQRIVAVRRVDVPD